jgi:hypothetical protein
MSDHLDQLLNSAESTLVELQTASEHITGFALQFGRKIGEIGRMLTQHPELAQKVDAFIERTAPIVERDNRLGRWFGCVYDSAESRSSDVEDYIDALALRSELEFFRDLYRDSAARNRIAGIDIDDTDQLLGEWGARHRIREIPAGIPASHIWWHRSPSNV